MIEQTAHEVSDQIGAQRPARPEVSEHPGQIGHAGEHHSAIGDGVREDERLAVDHEVDVPQHIEVEAGRGDDDVGLEQLAGLQENARLREAVDLVRDDGCLAGGDAPEQVAIRDEGDALPPRPVARREVRVDVVVGTEIGANARQQLLLHDLRFVE